MRSGEKTAANNMVKKLGTKKNRSKRLTIRQRKKQMKKAALHSAATRKAAKLSKLMGGNKLRKDPGIPNLWPFKEKLLKRAERERIKDEEQAEATRQRKALERAKRKKEMKTTGNIDAMAVRVSEWLSSLSTFHRVPCICAKKIFDGATAVAVLSFFVSWVSSGSGC